MSFIKDALFGTEGTPTKVVDTTPQAFQNLAGPTSQLLLQQAIQPNTYQGPYAAGLGQGEQQAMQRVQGAANQVGIPGAGQHMLSVGANANNPFAGFSSQEQQLLQQLMGQTGANPGAQNFAQQQVGGVMNPFAQAAGLGQGEQQGLSQIQQQAFQQNPQLQQFLGQQLQGQTNPFTQVAGLGQGEQQGLQQIQQTAFGPNQLQGTVNQNLQSLAGGGGQNPYAEQLMQAATRPILENFDEEALRQRGLYTQAGQQVQGQGSSPFADASAKLAGNVANAIGDTNAQLGANLFAQQQQGQLAALGLGQQQQGIDIGNQVAATQALGLPRQLQQQGIQNQADAFNQMQSNQFTAAGLGDQYANNAFSRALQGTEALGLPRQIEQLGLGLQSDAFSQMQQNQFAGAQLGDQLTNNAFSRALSGFEAAGVGQERQNAAFENQAGRQVTAGAQIGAQNLQQQQAQLDAQMQNLQAQALPRMVQQLGIEGGLNQFNQQQNQMLQLYSLLGNLSQATPAVLQGTAGQPGALQSFAGGFGEGFGKALPALAVASDRRAKKDIELIGKVGDVPMYQFRYIWDDDDAPLRRGVMADEVRQDAVYTDPVTGLQSVDYMKVFSHAA